MDTLKKYIDHNYIIYKCINYKLHFVVLYLQVMIYEKNWILNNVLELLIPLVKSPNYRLTYSCLESALFIIAH